MLDVGQLMSRCYQGTIEAHSRCCSRPLCSRFDPLGTSCRVPKSTGDGVREVLRGHREIFYTTCCVASTHHDGAQDRSTVYGGPVQLPVVGTVALAFPFSGISHHPLSSTCSTVRIDIVQEWGLQEWGPHIYGSNLLHSTTVLLFLLHRIDRRVQYSATFEEVRIFKAEENWSRAYMFSTLE